MQITPELRAQLDEQKKQCIYCKIVSKEMQGKTVFEDKKTEAVLDIYPPVKGHVVYLLKEHYPLIPYIPEDEFKHFVGLVPQLCKCIQKGMVSLGINVFIASGGAAGQQLPHFLMHILPREEGDGFFNFMFNRNAILNQEKKDLFAHNFPIMMGNHFNRSPAKWHQGAGETPDFLKDIYEKNTVIYEDEKLVCVIPEKGAVEGHLEIYSKVEEFKISKLSINDSFHLFSTASLASTLVFEGLGAQGTNIIIKSGKSDDNPQGKLVVHVLPRFFDDSLKGMHWPQKQASYNLDNIQSRIKEHAWQIKYVEEPEELSKEMPKEVTKIDIVKEVDSAPVKKKSSGNEIKDAIERLRYGD
ncbi:MAG: HIT domain-containing protein [Candidatus Woesearchaeota archaeon]